MQPQSSQRLQFEYNTSPEDAYFQRQRYNHIFDVLQRFVLLVGSSLTTMLTIRFFFALFDANTGNGIVSFINAITKPFVTPFYGLFNFDHASFGAISFQGYTLVAIFAYTVVIGGLAKLVSIARY